jgi:16S rRNA (adenine1518-N6/adenine1519-N6)-dimethyltransferase
MDVNRPLKKSLGQHLLKDKNLLAKMVRSTGITRNDTVIEIGPGHGDFTRAVAPHALHVYAIELDERFRDILNHAEKELNNVSFVFSDVLAVKFGELTNQSDIIVVGNIPYNVTGEILFKLLNERDIIKGAYLTMQKEVAERLVSHSHSKSYGALSVIFQLYAVMKILSLIKPGLFIPPPKVESAFISIVFKKESDVDPELIDFIKICFRHKRKYLRNSLLGPYTISEVDELYQVLELPPALRAEEIEPEGFVTLYRFMKRMKEGPALTAELSHV